MKFTTRQLLLFPVVLIINAGLVGAFTFPALRSFNWQHEVNSVRNAQDWIESAVRHCSLANEIVTDQTVNDWASQQLAPNHPAADRLMDPPRPDAWGNPYRIQPRKTFDEKPRVYSSGEDGLSNSNGNDSDDIRSWDEKRGAWYRRRQFTRESSYCIIVSLLITTAGFWLVFHNANGNRPA